MTRLSEIRKKVAPKVKTVTLTEEEISRGGLDGDWFVSHGYNTNIPVVPNIDAAIVRALEAGGKLKMDSFHGEDEDSGAEDKPCGTTHCIAGWAIALAGKPGFELEKRLQDSADAGGLIYAASRPGKPIPQFYTQNGPAMSALKSRAAADARRARKPVSP